MSVLSRYMQSLHQLHWTAACRVLKYLEGALGKGLYYRTSSHLDIVEYSNADWAYDSNDHRCTTGYCTFVLGNLRALR